jgi:DNA repair and recombination protein RAD54B
MVKEKEDAKKTLNVAAPKSNATKTAFKNPVMESTVMPQVSGPKPVPRHDPDAANALVMKRPNRVPKGKQIVDVVLDPILGKHLREHQREGVKFLYECVMGLRGFDGEGCILADEMGLGKTLQTIALLWTLLKQNPIHGDPPVIKKALIVCPVTLINNWQKEFRKWLGNERIGVFVADGKKTRLTDFTMGKSYNVMIIGYERLRTVAEDLTKGSGIDIVIADEGHRLKTVQNKSALAIQSLNTPKRVILSGTPIQNDLSEFFSMVNFVNDGLVGTYKAFMKNFEAPIVRSRQPNAVTKDIELGEARGEELAETTSPFILRRTADILSNYLPPKSEYVLFCNPTPVQANIYRHVVSSPMFQYATAHHCSMRRRRLPISPPIPHLSRICWQVYLPNCSRCSAMLLAPRSVYSTSYCTRSDIRLTRRLCLFQTTRPRLTCSRPSSPQLDCLSSASTARHLRSNARAWWMSSIELPQGHTLRFCCQPKQEEWVST